MHRQLPAALVSLLATSTLSSQSPPAPAAALAGLRVPIHTAPDLDGVPYGTWAAGATWKASFDGGMTFVPYLGDEYPHNQPWAWRTTSVRVGEHELLDGAPPRRDYSDYRCEFALGPVTEAYDVRSDGLEQTFVVGVRPGAGDLVVTGEVRTGLRAAPVAAAHGALTFFDEQGRAIVGYGAATAIDADGARVDIATSWQDGHVQLTVPGAWLATARLPVTIDPLLANMLLDTSSVGSIVRDVDVATATNGTRPVLVAFVRAASQFDDDVYAVHCARDFSNPAVTLVQITTSVDSDQISCTYVHAYPQPEWHIAWRIYFSTATPRVSHVGYEFRPIDASGISANWVDRVWPPAGHNDWWPRIGGTENGSTSLLVFQREDNSASSGNWGSTDHTEVHASFVDASFHLLAPEFLVRGDPGVDVQYPSVSEDATYAQGMAATSWLCAYQVYDYAAAPRWSVEARRIPVSGSLATIGTWTSALAASGTHHLVAPEVDGGWGRYGIAFTAIDLTTLPGHGNSRYGKQVWFERIDWPHTAGLPDVSPPPLPIASASSQTLQTTAVAYDYSDHSHFVLGWIANGAAAAAYAARIGYQGQMTEGPLTLHSGTASSVGCAFDGADVGFVCAFAGNTGVTPLYGRAFPYPAAPMWQPYGSSCSSNVIYWIGNQQIGADSNWLGVNGSSPQLHFPIASLAPIDVTVPLPEFPANCHLYVDPGAGFLMAAQFEEDPAWRLPLPEQWTPVTLYFQDWVWDGTNFLSSERLEVPVVK